MNDKHREQYSHYNPRVPALLQKSRPDEEPQGSDAEGFTPAQGSKFAEKRPRTKMRLAQREE